MVDKDATGEVARDDVVKVIRLLCLNPTPEEIAKLTDKASECMYRRQLMLSTHRAD